MKKILLEPVPAKTILVTDLMGHEIIAYRCPNSESVCVLHKMNKGNTHGFQSLQRSSGSPTYVAEGFYNSISLASKQRTCVAFDNQKELIEAIYKNRF